MFDSTHQAPIRLSWDSCPHQPPFQWIRSEIVIGWPNLTKWGSKHNLCAGYGLLLASLCYPLVNVYITIWKIIMFNGKINYKWPFSIAMLNYQRVTSRGVLAYLFFFCLSRPLLVCSIHTLRFFPCSNSWISRPVLDITLREKPFIFQLVAISHHIISSK